MIRINKVEYNITPKENGVTRKTQGQKVRFESAPTIVEFTTEDMEDEEEENEKPR